MSDQLREVVGRFLDDDAADRFVATALRSAFTDSSGNVDEEKVAGHLTAIHLAAQPQQPPRNWGRQSAAGGPGKRPGDDGRAALKKRHNVGDDPNTPTAGAQVARGRSAKAELARRYPKGGRR